MPIQTYYRRDEIGGYVRWGVSTELTERMQELSVQLMSLFTEKPIRRFIRGLAEKLAAGKFGRRSFPGRDD